MKTLCVMAAERNGVNFSEAKPLHDDEALSPRYFGHERLQKTKTIFLYFKFAASHAKYAPSAGLIAMPKPIFTYELQHLKPISLTAICHDGHEYFISSRLMTRTS